MITATEILKQIDEAAKAPKTETRDATNLAIHKGVRQGDVYLWRVADKSGVGAPIANYQLAPGTSQGSRHVVEGDARVYEHAGANSKYVDPGAALFGPTLVVGKDCATVTHPEHAHIRLGPGKWQVTYQMDAMTRQRVID